MKRKEIDMYMERMEAIKDFMESDSVSQFQDQVIRTKDFLQRFESLDALLAHLKVIEDMCYTIKEFLTIDEVAKYLGVSKSMVYKMTSNKSITVYKPTGKGIYIHRNDLLQWMKRNPILSDEEIAIRAKQKMYELEKERNQNS